MTPLQIRSIVRQMSESKRKDLLQQIEMRKGVSQLLGRGFNPRMADFLVGLLKGEDVRNPYPQVVLRPRSGKVRVLVA